ncbi:MAG: hypothetical protein AAF702_45715 [Chloroflexota bacterium]
MRHATNRITTRAFVVPVVAGVVVFLIASMLFRDISIDREMKRELLERERIQTELERKRAEERAERAELVTEAIDALLTVLFYVVVLAVVVALLWNGNLLLRARVRTANMERYKVAGNGRYLLDVFTSETFDLQSGQVYANQTTAAKLMIHAQAERIHALNDGTQWTSGKAKTALGAYRQHDLPQYEVKHVEREMVLLPDNAEIELASGTRDLMNYSDRYAWVLGQSQTTGELSEFTIKDDCNLLICGAKGQGKTQLALMLMAYARVNGFHTIVADGKGGLDFRKYHDVGLIEWFPIDENNMWDFVVQLEQEFKNREALLSNARCAELDAYNRQSDQPIDRLLIIIEEFGGTVEGIRAIDSKLAKSIVGILGSILKRARATGIHVVMLDQTITGDVYNNSIKANLKYVAYKLPGHQYKVLDVPKDVKLLNRGEFVDYEASEEQKFLTFYTESDCDLMGLPKQGAKNVFSLVTGSQIYTEKSRYSSEKDSITVTSNEHNRYDNESHNEPITSYNDVDWSLYSRLSGKSRNQVLIDELPKLTGPAETPAETQYVLAAHSNLPSREAVYFAVWGGKNGDRRQWLDDVIENYSNCRKENNHENHMLP